MASRAIQATGLLAGPVIALFTHEFIYLATYQECAPGGNPLAHAVPAVGLLLVLTAAFIAYREQRETAHSSTESASEARKRARGHFLAMMGLAMSLFCALVVAAQWFAIVVFGTCAQR